jgi:hypothetical protein
VSRYLRIFVPCIECGGEGGQVSELLDERPTDTPVIQPGDEMPVLHYDKSEFAIEVPS